MQPSSGPSKDGSGHGLINVNLPTAKVLERGGRVGKERGKTISRLYQDYSLVTNPLIGYLCYKKSSLVCVFPFPLCYLWIKISSSKFFFFLLYGRRKRKIDFVTRLWWLFQYIHIVNHHVVLNIYNFMNQLYLKKSGGKKTDLVGDAIGTPPTS